MPPNHTHLRRRLSDQTVVGQSMDGTVEGSDVGETDSSVLDERDERTSEADEAGSVDRRAGAHMVHPSGMDTGGAEKVRMRVRDVSK